MAERGLWDSAINRLYYACFYAVSALLIHHGLVAKSHNGIRTLFFQQFLKSKKLPQYMGSLYAKLFDQRQESDYDDFQDFSHEDVEDVLDPVRQFLIEIADYIATN